MNNNAQKWPLAQSLNGFVDNRLDAFGQTLQESLPASVVSIDESHTIVRVKFEIASQYVMPIVEMPVFGPEWVRWPIAAGTKGVVLSATAALGGVSGLGTGIATFANPGNLSCGVFFPIGNTGNDPTLNDRAVVLYGPDGVVLTNKPSVEVGGADQSLTKGVQIKVDGEGNVMIYGAKSVSTDVQGYGQRTTYIGGNAWRVDIYDLGATVTTNHLPVHPPMIPDP